MATCATVESPEVMVTDELIPVQEFDRVKNAVCLLRPSTSDPSKSWSATGFYADVNLKKRDDKENVHCIMTNYHVFCKMKQHDHTVAVFHHDGTQKKHVEIPIMPFALLASSKELDYVLIGIDKSKMQSIGVKPILADINQPPIVKKNDKVLIIQHPKGKMKYFSHDTVKDVKRPFLEYNANTLKGSSGSPVFVVKESKYFLVALHSKGVKSYPSNWNKGVLFSEILNHLLTGKDQTTFLTDDEYLSDLKAHIDENGVSNIQDFLSKKLEGWKDVKIRVGVTGDSGTGKSAFINAIRGLNDDQYDKGAATVGETETTTEPKEYQHPDNPKIIFVDLPGIGTPNYPDLPTYCEKVSLEDYDTFLIFTATRFTKNDLDLAKKVKGIGKSFFLIRTKIDVDLTPKKGKAPIDEDKILRKIKSKCLKNVEGLISDESEIFLIGNYDKDKWDFDRLINAIGDKLHTYQKECLTLSLSNVTRECLKRKARFLKVQAIVVALASAATGKIPIPGVQGVINDLLIGSTLLFYQNKFGLHNMSEGLFKDRIEYFLSAIACDSSIVGFEKISESYSSIGKAIDSILSFTWTLRFLSLKIDAFEKAALAVWDNATKQSI